MQKYKKISICMENQEKKEKMEKMGFERGIRSVYLKCTAAEYDFCLAEANRICMTTEERGASRSSYYNKRYGRTPLTVAETNLLADLFARFGITDWQGQA